EHVGAERVRLRRPLQGGVEILAQRVDGDDECGCQRDHDDHHKPGDAEHPDGPADDARGRAAHAHRRPTLGSRNVYDRSTMTLTAITISVKKTTAPCSIGRSRWSAATVAAVPRPGSAKIVSTKTTAPRS